MVEPYELGRLREEARRLGIALEAVAPEEIDLIVSRGGRRSIGRCGAEVELPSALLPRTGRGTDDFARAILRQLEHLGVPVITPQRCDRGGQGQALCPSDPGPVQICRFRTQCWCIFRWIAT